MINSSVNSYNRSLKLFKEVRLLWDSLENASDYQYIEALDKIETLQKHIAKIDISDVEDYLKEKGKPELIDDVKHNLNIFKEGAHQMGREILGWSYYKDLMESVPRYIFALQKKYPSKYPDKDYAKRFVAEIIRPNNVERYKRNIESIIRGNMTVQYFSRIFEAVMDGIKNPKREIIKPLPTQIEQTPQKPSIKKFDISTKKEEKSKPNLNISKEKPTEFLKGRKNFIKTSKGEFEYDFETRDSSNIVHYYNGDHEVYSYLDESKKTINMKNINEDFYNPFGDDESAKESKKPKQISDKGGSLLLRKETFNLSRVEFSKRPGGEYTVIAKTQFAKGDIVEICPVIILKEEAKTIDKLKDIIFEIDRESNEWALVLGYGSLYRHNEKANLDYAYNKLTKQMYFITKRPIKLAEELTLNYGQDYWMERMTFNTMDDIERTDKNQGMPIISGKVVTKDEKDIDESEIEPNSADIKNQSTIKNISSPNNPANPVRSGVAIIGTGQQ